MESSPVLKPMKPIQEEPYTVSSLPYSRTAGSFSSDIELQLKNPRVPFSGSTTTSMSQTTNTTVEKSSDKISASVQFYVHSGMIIVTFSICILGIIISPSGPNAQWFQSIAMLCLGLILPNPKSDEKKLPE